MKKLIMLSAIAALTSGAALAGTFQVSGSNPSVCEATTSLNAVSFPVLQQGKTSNIPFTLRCNDADGATVSLTSSEGQLETTDGQDATGVGYSAKLSAAPYNFTLTALSGVNNQVAKETHSGSPALAAGGVAGNILLTVLTNPIYAGSYNDDLMLTVEAN
ncbi:hypothetical protein [Marinomonas flavescens]|uniref:hypothetical protein n=1 Tax=Marinomonas flavescens TaxID=2529379 RepID=UPI001054FFD9|nr:hypothetical protein [Marinomonas flavescens]